MRPPTIRPGLSGPGRVAVWLLLTLLSVSGVSAAFLDPIGGGIGSSNAFFATAVVASRGPFGPAPYDSPESLLGRPATDFYDPWGAWSGGTTSRRVKIVEPAFNLDPTQTNKLITTFGEGSFVILKLGQPATNDPANPYGVDLLVFGNSFYTSAGFVSDSSDMATLRVTGGTFEEPLKISVSPGFSGLPGEQPDNPETWPWHRYDNGPFGDTAFPTQGYPWDRKTTNWSDRFSDFTKPVNPAVTTPARSGGLSAADIIDLYAGSGGGTGFDLAPSGFQSVSYIKIEGVGPDWTDGEIDAVSVVKPASLGGTLSVLPANITNGPARLFFQQTPAPARNAARVDIATVGEAALVQVAAATTPTNGQPLSGTVLGQVALQVSPVLGSNQVQFAADLFVALPENYSGSGLDLEIWRWSGSNWLSNPFVFDAPARALQVGGLTNNVLLAVTQVVPPSITIIREPNGAVSVRFTPLAGWTHRLERSTDLSTWTELISLSPATLEPITVPDQQPPADRAVYRLRLHRAP